MLQRGLLLLCCFACGVAAAPPAALTLTRTIALPGVEGRFDHFALDVNGKRLLVAALGNDTLEVLDLAAGRVAKSVSGLHRPTGVVFLPEANRIGVANAGDGTFKFFDGVTYAMTGSIDGMDDADNARFDPLTQRIYAGYGEGALAIINTATMQQTATIALPAHPEAFQLETHGERLFINLPDAQQIAVVQRDQHSVSGHWPMSECQANFPLALDEANQRLFVGCRKPARVLVVDTTTGQPVTSFAICGDTDDLFYDSARRRLYVSCGEGFVDVIDQRDADHYQLRERIATRAGARTAFFSAALNAYYVAVPRQGRETAEVRVFQTQ